MEDSRKVFDTIPEKFEKWRSHYSKELFDFIVKTCDLNDSKSCLEIGPGTGQATDFALQSGCDYHAIELGEHFVAYMKQKYKAYKNFDIVNADFEKFQFEKEKYNLVYSAATIQWIKEDVAYKKSFDMLKTNGYLAMFLLRGDYKSTNPALFNDIQKVYDNYFVTDAPYKQKFNYENAPSYGFKLVCKKEFPSERIFSADDYVQYIGTHSDHILLKEEYREKFFNGIHDAIIKHGGQIKFNDTYVLYLYQK